MMIAVVGEYVAARSEWSPADARLVQLMHDRRRLLFRVRGDNPIDGAAHTQTRQLRKTLSTFSAHTESRRYFFNRFISFCKHDHYSRNKANN